MYNLLIFNAGQHSTDNQNTVKYCIAIKREHVFEPNMVHVLSALDLGCKGLLLFGERLLAPVALIPKCMLLSVAQPSTLKAPRITVLFFCAIRSGSQKDTSYRPGCNNNSSIGCEPLYLRPAEFCTLENVSVKTVSEANRRSILTISSPSQPWEGATILVTTAQNGYCDSLLSCTSVTGMEKSILYR